MDHPALAVDAPAANKATAANRRNNERMGRGGCMVPEGLSCS